MAADRDVQISLSDPLKFLSGYRTILAGFGAIGLGVYLLTEGKIEEGAASITAGLMAFGLGGKLDKVADAVKENTAAVEQTTAAVETTTAAVETAAAPPKKK